MAATYKDNGGSVNGSNKVFTYDFPVLQTEDIKVALNGVTQATTKYTPSLSPANITFNNTSVDSSVQESDGSPKSGVTVRVYRETTVGKANGDEDPKAVFAAGSSIRAGDLNANIEQALFGIHEQQDKLILAENINTGAVTSAKILDDTIVNADVNASAAIAGTKVNPNFGSQAVSTSGTLASGATTVTGNIAVSGTVDGRDVATDGSKLDGIEAGATGNQTNAEIRTAVEAASDSNVFTDADHSKLNAIEASATADQTNAEIRTAVEAASDSNVFTDADHTKLNSVETGATADQTNAEIRTAVEAASDSNVFTDADHTKVNAAATVTGSETLTNKTLTSPVINDMSGTAVVTSGTSTSDTKTYSAKRAGEIFYGKDTVGEIQSGETWSAADDKVATTSAIDARIIDLVDDVGGFVPIANETSFPNANPDVNNGAGTLVSIKALASNLTSNGSGVATIANGTVGNSTVTITGLANSTTYASTFGMIVETTTTLNTYTFHRQVPKATEVTTVSGSISNVNTVAGAISNVNAVAGNATNINAVAGNNSNITSVAGNASNINSAVSNASNINSAVSNASNINTTAGSISNVNTVAGSISNVNEVATNMGSVNDFAARYRTGANNPTSSLDTGDLFFNTSANELKVYNGSAWQGGVTASGNFASVTGNTFTGDNLYNDSVKAKFGTGSDLQIYHDGSNSHINNTTGYIVVGTDSYAVKDQTLNEFYIKALKDGAVELYYDNVKKIETSSAGITVTGGAVVGGNLELNSDAYLKIGASTDLQLYHAGGNSSILNTTGVLTLKNTGSGKLQLMTQNAQDVEIKTNNELSIKSVANGGVELYYDNSKTFQTTSYGAEVIGTFRCDALSLLDNEKIQLGSSGSDLEIYHDGTQSVIKNATGNLDIITGSTSIDLQGNDGSETLAKFIPNGAVELYYDNSKKFETYTNGVIVTGTLSADQVGLGDNEKIILGVGDDLQIFHDGGNSWVKEVGTGALYIDTDGAAVKITQGGASENMAVFNKDGAVELYYDNSKKFETLAVGVRVASGNLYMYDSGEIICGTGGDLKIFHDGSNSNIQNGTGWINIYAGGQGFSIGNGDFSEQLFKAIPNGATELYYDNDLKLFTRSAGAEVTTTGAVANFIVRGKEGYGACLTLASDDGDDPGDYARILQHTDEHLYFQVYNAANNAYENAIVAKHDGTVELYYDNSKRFETKSDGCIITGSEGGNAALYLYADEGDDNADKWQLYADNSGNCTLINYASGSWETNFKTTGNGAAELYYDGVRKAYTNSGGFALDSHLIMGDYDTVKLGNGADLQLYHTGTNSIIQHSGTGDLYVQTAQTDEDLFLIGGSSVFMKPAGGADHGVKAIKNGAVELYYDGSLKLTTSSTGIEVSGNVHVNDNNKFQCGNSADLQIYHSGSHSYIKDAGTGELIIQGSGVNIYDGNNKSLFYGVTDGSASLYYNNSKKFETTSSGVTVTGALKSDNVCKAWCNWNGKNTPAIKDSYNIASITDIDTAQVTVNIDTDLSNANYAVTSHARADSGGGGRLLCGKGTPAAGSYLFQTVNTGNNNEETEDNCVAFFGDGG